ncbi:hypothetical protein C0W27_05580 [Photobacterium angustum]|uniref:Uncharacterized protein n=1 Tax=Photobacterium angustum TaxID=661 RepID=A0ABX5H8H5_PHOAN|nr:hypothetical protein C0W27_05580 [Photobacterium angustum]
MKILKKTGLTLFVLLSSGSVFSADDSSFWNQELTNLMRSSKENTFANWSNDPSIQVGAIGYLNYLTGEFTLVSTDMVDDPVYFLTKRKDEKWEFSSKNTSKNSSEVKVDGGYLDPNSGVKVDVGMEHSWVFSKAKSLAATYIIAVEAYTNNPYGLVADKWDIIKSAAEKTPYIDHETGDISQGFGYISGVKWASRGVAIASNDDEGQYSIVTSMNVTSPKKDQIGLTPKLISEKGSNSVTATKFPATRDEIGELVPVAFTFTSIDGKRPINNWTQPINQLELIINSKPGSTYITKWQVAYKTVTNKNIQHKSGAFPAPQSASVYLPKDAVDVQLSIKLPGVFSSNRCEVVWKDPINQWNKGKKEVQTYGIWPANAWCTELKSSIR